MRLLQALRVDPDNQQAVGQFLNFTKTMVAAFAENDRPNLEMAETVAQQAFDELQRLIEESTEYQCLHPNLEKLNAVIESIQNARTKQEDEKSVT